MIPAAGPAPDSRRGRPLALAAAIVAFAGALETAWLTLTWLAHGHVPCTASARLDCEALFLAAGTAPLGLPLPVWGHAAYAIATLAAPAAALFDPPASARARSVFGALAPGMAGARGRPPPRMLSPPPGLPPR